MQKNLKAILIHLTQKRQRLRSDVKDETKEEDDEDAEDNEPADHSDGEGEGLDADDVNLAAADSNLLTDFQHKFEQALRQPSRALLVKDLMIMFEAGSIYGKRAGFHKALMITAPCPQSLLPRSPVEVVVRLEPLTHTCLIKLHRVFFEVSESVESTWLAPIKRNGGQLEASASSTGNIFWKSLAWKRQVINDVIMCPRQDMFKAAGTKMRMDAALTDIQEAKQVT